MRRMHTDPGSARVEAFLPLILAYGRASAATGDSTLLRALTLLDEWDGLYRPDNQRAILFELVMRETGIRLFDELIPPGDSTGVPAARPEMAVLAALHDSGSVWWDDRRTAGQVETRDAIVAAGLRAALDTAVARYGPPDAGGWRWGTVWPTDIWHLLRLPGLSSPNVAVQGGPSTIAPAGRHSSHGPSWRMVVELGPEVTAWSTYPGGQSGNPASPWYANRIPQWAAGELDPVLFPLTAEALDASRVRGRFTFQPAR
jgi:penicillin amidase